MKISSYEASLDDNLLYCHGNSVRTKLTRDQSRLRIMRSFKKPQSTDVVGSLIQGVIKIFLELS